MVSAYGPKVNTEAAIQVQVSAALHKPGEWRRLFQLNDYLIHSNTVLLICAILYEMLLRFIAVKRPDLLCGHCLFSYLSSLFSFQFWYWLQGPA